MSYWKVTYRDKAGKPVEDRVEADGREALFSKLKSRGISAIRVEECKKDGRSRIRHDGGRSNSRSARMLLLGLVVILAVVAGLYLARLMSGAQADDHGDKPKAIKPSAKIPAVATVSTNKASAASVETPPAAETNETAKSEFDDGRVLQSATTNGMYIVEIYKMPDGKKLKKYRHSVKSIWTSNTDQLLHMALTTPPGVEMPPLPFTHGVLTKEFYDSLKTPIVVNDNDSDEVREAKERVINARETVKQLLSEGYTLEEILADHERKNKEDASLRREVSERIEEIKREGDIDMAREYMNKANEFLRSSGITEVRDRSLEQGSGTEKATTPRQHKGE